MNDQDAPKSSDRAAEQRYYGRRLCGAIFERRPGDIISVRLEKQLLHDFGPLLKWCAENRKAYQLVDREHLNKLAKSTHHEGIVILGKKKAVLTADDFLNDVKSGEVKGCVLALDGVENPHNFGAILRSAANFGVRTVLSNDEDLKGLSAAACRVSEGGSECVKVYRVPALLGALKELKQRSFVIVGTSSKSKANVFSHNFAADTCVILGSEGHGVSKDVLKVADLSVRIPGSGDINSLNVSAAATVFLSEYWRQKA